MRIRSLETLVEWLLGPAFKLKDYRRAKDSSLDRCYGPWLMQMPLRSVVNSSKTSKFPKPRYVVQRLVNFCSAPRLALLVGFVARDQASSAYQRHRVKQKGAGWLGTVR